MQAKENAAEDKKKKESVEVRNQADNLVFQTKKQIEEMKDKIPADAKTKLEAEITKVEEALKTDNTDAIKSATDDLNKVWNEIAQNLYQQAGAQPGADPGAAGAQEEKQAESEAGSDEKTEKEVQDASYEVVDDDEEDKDKK
jgi:molecular chaperone DnaK